jgi:hypothetical protein
MKKLEAIQRKGLSICLGLPATSGREAMEVEGNILPGDVCQTFYFSYYIDGIVGFSLYMHDVVVKFDLLI